MTTKLISSVPFVSGQPITLMDSSLDCEKIDIKAFFLSKKSLETDVSQEISQRIQQIDCKAYVVVGLDERDPPNSVYYNSYVYTFYLGKKGAFASTDHFGKGDYIEISKGGVNVFKQLSDIRKYDFYWKAALIAGFVGASIFIGFLSGQIQRARINGLSSLVHISNWKDLSGLAFFGSIAAISVTVYKSFFRKYDESGSSILHTLVSATIQVHNKVKKPQETPPSIEFRKGRAFRIPKKNKSELTLEIIVWV